MRSSGWLTAMCALALGGAAQLCASHAAAQECEDDGDCASGLICKSYGAETCAQPAIDCPEGQDCPEPEPCEPMELKQCALPPCETDDDCPSGTVCHSETYRECSGSSDAGSGAQPVCPDGEECPQPEQPACEDPDCKEDVEVTCQDVATEPVCTPVWQLPCSENSDCGAGFTCEEQISMWCSGSSGGAEPTPDGDPLPAPEPSEPECGSEPTGEFRCELVVTECSSDDDCAEGWTCEANPSRPVCDSAERPASSGDGDSAGAGGSGGFAPPAEDTPEDSCGESTEPEHVCMPPYYEASGGVGRGYDAEAGGVATGSDDNAAEPPQNAAEDDGDEAEESASGADGEESDGGCSVAAPGADMRGSALSLLGLLGVCALLRRRARRA